MRRAPRLPCRVASERQCAANCVESFTWEPPSQRPSSHVDLTLIYMTPTEYAADEIALWEQARREECELELQLDTARRNGPWQLVVDLLPQVRALRARAALLLADAVRVKCMFRDAGIAAAGPSNSSTAPRAAADLRV